jgi:hypothetical protein
LSVDFLLRTSELPPAELGDTGLDEHKYFSPVDYTEIFSPSSAGGNLNAARIASLNLFVKGQYPNFKAREMKSQELISATLFIQTHPLLIKQKQIIKAEEYQDYASTYITKSEFKQLEKEVHNLSKDLEKVKMNFKSKK